MKKYKNKPNFLLNGLKSLCNNNLRQMMESLRTQNVSIEIISWPISHKSLSNNFYDNLIKDSKLRKNSEIKAYFDSNFEDYSLKLKNLINLNLNYLNEIFKTINKIDELKEMKFFIKNESELISCDNIDEIDHSKIVKEIALFKRDFKINDYNLDFYLNALKELEDNEINQIDLNSLTLKQLINLKHLYKIEKTNDDKFEIETINKETKISQISSIFDGSLLIFILFYAFYLFFPALLFSLISSLFLFQSFSFTKLICSFS